MQGHTSRFDLGASFQQPGEKKIVKSNENQSRIIFQAVDSAMQQPDLVVYASPTQSPESSFIAYPRAGSIQRTGVLPRFTYAPRAATAQRLGSRFGTGDFSATTDVTRRRPVHGVERGTTRVVREKCEELKVQTGAKAVGVKDPVKVPKIRPPVPRPEPFQIPPQAQQQPLPLAQLPGLPSRAKTTFIKRIQAPSKTPIIPFFPKCSQDGDNLFSMLSPTTSEHVVNLTMTCQNLEEMQALYESQCLRYPNHSEWMHPDDFNPPSFLAVKH